MLHEAPLYGLPLDAFDTAYSESVADALAVTLRNPHKQRSWLVRAYPRDASTSTDPPTTIEVLLSTDGHRNHADDTEHLQYTEAVITPYDVTFGLDKLWGQSRTNLGSVVIGDPDGGLRSITGEDWQGRQCDIYVGPRGGTQVQFARVGRLLSRDLSYGRQEMDLILDDYGYLFRKPLGTATYGGTGGLDGDSEVKGRLKPILLGRVRRFEPILVDGTNRVYQLHDGSVATIDGVEVAGVALSFDTNVADITTATPATGEYATALATGHIKLGSDPDGVVLVTGAQGHNSSSLGYVDTVAGLLQLLAVDYAGLPADDIGLVTFAALATHTAEMGGYFTDKIPILDVIERFHQSAASYGWLRPTRTFDVGRITDPSAATADFALNANVGDIRDENWHNDPYEVRVWRVVVLYRPYPRPLLDTEIDSSVALATRQDYGKAYRVAEAEDASILVQTPEATELEIQTDLDDEADAQALADEQLALRGVLRRQLTLSPRIGLIERGIGDVVEVVDDRLPVSPSKYVILHVENAAAESEDPDRIVWECYG